MKLIQLPRGFGKTTMLLKMSAANKIPIVCAYQQTKDNLQYQAKMLDLKIPEPYTVAEIINEHKWRNSEKPFKCYVDEIDAVLNNALQCSVVLGTHTEEGLYFNECGISLEDK